MFISAAIVEIESPVTRMRATVELIFNRFNDELKNPFLFLKSSRESFSSEGELIKALVNSSEWEIILKFDESESWGKYSYGRVSQITSSFESLQKLKNLFFLCRKFR